MTTNNSKLNKKVFILLIPIGILLTMATQVNADINPSLEYSPPYERYKQKCDLNQDNKLDIDEKSCFYKHITSYNYSYDRLNQYEIKENNRKINHNYKRIDRYRKKIDSNNKKIEESKDKIEKNNSKAEHYNKKIEKYKEKNEEYSRKIGFCNKKIENSELKIIKIKEYLDNLNRLK